MKLTTQLANIELLDKLFSDKFISDYFLNADPTIFKDVVRNDIFSILLDAKSETGRSETRRNQNKMKQEEVLIKKYKESRIIKTILVEMYQEILDGKRKTFPQALFKGFQGKLNCCILFKYIFTEKLNWSFNKLMKEIDKKTVVKHKLRSIYLCYPNMFSLIKETFPEKNIKPYYLSKAKNIWQLNGGSINEQLVKEAVEELVSTVISNNNSSNNNKNNINNSNNNNATTTNSNKYSLKNIPQWIKYNHFTENILPYDANLSYMLHVCFDNSPGRAVMFAFPDLNLEPHYFSNVPKGYWQNKENVKAVSKEFLEILTNKEGKYRFTEEELQQYLTPKLYAKPILPFRKKLNGLLVKGLGNDPKKVERFI